MKKVLKVITAAMVAVLALGMAGCTEHDSGARTRHIKGSKTEVNIEELKKNEGVMLTIRAASCASMTSEEQEHSGHTMSVTYGGCACNPNPVSDSNVDMSDEDYVKVYRFCVDAVSTGKFDKYKENADDGTKYTFTFYDTEGTEHRIYQGYCYSNAELWGIIELVAGYSVD